MKTKVLSIVLSVALLVTFIPVFSFADTELSVPSVSKTEIEQTIAKIHDEIASLQDDALELHETAKAHLQDKVSQEDIDAVVAEVNALLVAYQGEINQVVDLYDAFKAAYEGDKELQEKVDALIVECGELAVEIAEEAIASFDDVLKYVKEDADLHQMIQDALKGVDAKDTLDAVKNVLNMDEEEFMSVLRLALDKLYDHLYGVNPSKAVKEVADLKAQLEEMAEEYDAQIADLNDEYADLNDQYADLNDEYAALYAEKERINAVKHVYYIQKTSAKIKSAKGLKNSASIKWGKFIYATKYQICYKKATDKKAKYIYVNAKNTSKVFKKLAKNTNYTFKVRAIIKYNSKTFYGKWSKVKTVKVK